MVNMKIILNSPKHEESSDLHRIKLEPEQASKVPFPPGCNVVVLEKSSIVCSAEVTAVYISFAHNSGSCDNCYEVLYTDLKGCKGTLVVRGDQLRYGIDCPINISPPSGTNTFNENEVIEGTIKGFELQGDVDDNGEPSKGGTDAFLYTVEVSAAIDDSQERLYRQRGIGPEHIRFRPVQKSSYLQDGKTSVISFDETTIASYGKDDTRQLSCNDRKVHMDKSILNHTVEETPSSPHFSKAMTNFSSPQHQLTCQPTTFQEQSQQPFGKSYAKCAPLKSPIPNHFQGDMKLCRDEKVPEFTFLVNFPLCNKQANLPPGKRCSVMCGELRWASPSNRSKGKNTLDNKAFIPNQNKGLCTLCDVNIWVVHETRMHIIWCKGCKNFQTWAAFGEKGSATKCMRCRDRQREKYALSKGLKVEKSCEIKRKALDSEAAESKKRVSL